MKRLILLLVAIFALYGCEDSIVVESETLVQDSVENTDDNNVEEILTKEYLDDVVDKVDEFSQLTQGVVQYLEELIENPLVSLDDEWMAELGGVFDKIEDVFLYIDRIENIPDEYFEFHQHIQMSVMYSVLSREYIIEGIESFDGDLIDEGISKISISNGYMKEARKVLSDKKE